MAKQAEPRTAGGGAMAKAYDPRDDRGRASTSSGSRAATSSRAAATTAAAAVLHHHAAAERHRRAAHRPRAHGHRRGHPHPLAPHARRPDALGARHRPRRHRDAERRREAAREGRPDAPRPRPRRVREARLAVGRQRYRPIISNQHRRLGASADWSREVFTLDDGAAARGAHDVQEDVRRRADLPRRAADQLVPALPTALSDLEVEHEEQQGSLWYIRYPARRRHGRRRAPARHATST